MKIPAYEKSSKYYDLIYEARVDYEKECALLDSILSRYPERKVERILDVGSGTGNHAILLSSRGYEVLGIDLSEDFVRLAGQKAEGLDNPPAFRVGDMRNLTVDGRFDAILCMFGAFSHIQRSEARQVLAGFFEHLSEGGIAVFEFWNRLGVKPPPRHGRPRKSWIEREAENLRLIRLDASDFDAEAGVIDATMKHYVLRGRELEEVFEEHYRLTTYLRKEMRGCLRQAGFHTQTILDWDDKALKPPRRDTFRLLAVARRPT